MKLNLVNNISWSDHRSGWEYVLQNLTPFQSKDGLVVDGFIDKTFGYGVNYSKETLDTLLNHSWVGFIHHPINICPWYYQDNLSPSYVFDSEGFIEASKQCEAIFTLSNHLAEFVKMKTGIMTYSLIHPTEIPQDKFNFRRFTKDKKVVHIGTWMRKFSSFYKLRAESYKKYLLCNSITMQYLKSELQYCKQVSANELNSVDLLSHLDNSKYDLLLNESVVFLDLFDSSANNTVIECIVRETPLIVNKIPSVVEYLGESYPLYYRNLEEAEAFLNDTQTIKKAHEYLKDEVDKERFSVKYFIESLEKTGLFT